MVLLLPKPGSVLYQIAPRYVSKCRTSWSHGVRDSLTAGIFSGVFLGNIEENAAVSDWELSYSFLKKHSRCHFRNYVASAGH